MKSPFLKLIFAVLLAAAAGTGVYFWRTAPARARLCCERPELAWLQHEFKVPAANMERVTQLHEAYLDHCMDLCVRIQATNSLVRVQFERDGAVTPAVDKLLGQSALLRLQCQKQMLGYFVQVSQSMPPEEGKRYLAWMQERIFTMSHEPLEPAETASTHVH